MSRVSERSLHAFRFNWREFAILTVAGAVGAILLIPYILTLQGPLLRTRPIRIPLPLLLTLQMGQSAILIALLVGVGLLLAPRCGLGAPLLERWLARASMPPGLAKRFGLAAAAGAAVCLLVIGLDLWFFERNLPKIGETAAINPPAWQGFLASFYGGITEELLVRLGAMSFFVWLLAKVWHDNKTFPKKSAFWMANILAALLFGLGHLPATAAVMPLTMRVVLRVLVLNGLPGLVFGWLYWKQGLESAMVAHFAGDLVLHVATPLVAPR